MKRLSLLALLVLAGCGHKWNNEPQLASGEWSVEVRLPDCDPKTIEPLWDPKNPNKMTIECHLMPVQTR